MIQITCAEDLLELSRNCALDTWSQGKHVALTADISLAGTGYTPIPTFGGTFDGGGYTISGLDLSSGLTPAGVFGTLQEGAVVKDLHVTGSIEPSGHGSSIGGIAGENYGVIAACSFSGTITGTDRVGGIAGQMCIRDSSTTKYMDGHGAAVGGAIVDSGNFDWMAHAEKFPGLTTPDDSYHGITYAEKFGQAGAFITKCTAQLMRDFGSIQSPQNAFLLNLGLESLHVRMARHCENGLAVARFLKDHPKVSFVTYPGLEGDKYYDCLLYTSCPTPLLTAK